MSNEQTTYNRSKVWQIALFTLNNSATNAALLLIGRYAYFTQNVLGLMAVVIGAIAMIMRIFDGITDPLIGYLLDKTNTKFGRYRPFMVLGCAIMCLSLLAIFHAPLTMSKGLTYVYVTVLYVIYIIGYTFQTTVTKAAQTLMTNDPKQRPLYSGFEALGTRIVGAFIAVLITNILAAKYSVWPYVGEGMRNPDMWKAASKIICLLMIGLTVLAMIGIWEKDRPENYLKTKAEKIRMKDYLDIISHNRPIQMLIISAATDKLGLMLSNGLLVYVCSNLLLNSGLEGKYTIASLVPIMVSAFIGVGISRKKGLKRNFIIGTVGSMLMLTVLLIVKPNPEHPWLWLTLLIIQNCIYVLSNGSVVPMLADCTDYETYRSGRYVPGMIGTIFSFVDKLLSSLSNLIVGLALTVAGVGNSVIPPNTVMGDKFNAVILICFCGIPILGHICSIIAMKFYDLDDKKMEFIQSELNKGRREVKC
ncbi:MAG: MFS transporter [Erysipelotrichaceae bacterium]